MKDVHSPRPSVKLGTGRIRFRRARFQTPSSVRFFGPHRAPGRELSEFLSAYYLCTKANSPSLSQNSPSLAQNSVSPLFRNIGPATTQNLAVKFDGEICGGVLVENASDDFPQQKRLENLLPNFAGSSPPISPKTSPTSLWKSLVLRNSTLETVFRPFPISAGLLGRRNPKGMSSIVVTFVANCRDVFSPSPFPPSPFGFRRLGS